MTNRPPATRRAQKSSSQKSSDAPEPMISRMGGSVSAPIASTHRSTPFTRMPLRLSPPRGLIAQPHGPGTPTQHPLSAPDLRLATLEARRDLGQQIGHVRERGVDDLDLDRAVVAGRL